MRMPIPERWRKRVLILSLALVTVASVGAITAFVSPWPGTVAIRWMSADGMRATDAELDKFAPPNIVSVLDQQYRDDDPAARLDVYYPEASTTPLPTVIWVHGGGWISGSPSDNAGYYQLLASQGFTVVSVGYSLGPEAQYPTALKQINDAFGYLEIEAGRLHIDPNQLFLGGDSAGAQIASQMAVTVTDPSYAAEVGIEPALSAEQLRGTVLDCGVYDMDVFLEPEGKFRWTEDKESIWAYTGSKDFESSPVLDEMSTLDHVTSSFPPSFITGGNIDPLTVGQSKPLADKLSGLGVEVDSLFYPDEHEPGLDHEYQFDLDSPEGKAAFDRTVAFLRNHTK